MLALYRLLDVRKRLSPPLHLSAETIDEGKIFFGTIQRRTNCDPITGSCCLCWLICAFVLPERLSS